MRERFAVPVRAWLSQAWAFARSAEPRAPLSRRAILTDIAIAAVALVASLLVVRATYAAQPAQYGVDPGTGALVVVGVTGVQQVWEHAFLLDYKPAERPKYVEAFFANIDWDVVNARLDAAKAERPIGS